MPKMDADLARTFIMLERRKFGGHAVPPEWSDRFYEQYRSGRGAATAKVLGFSLPDKLSDFLPPHEPLCDNPEGHWLRRYREWVEGAAERIFVGGPPIAYATGSLPTGKVDARIIPIKDQYAMVFSSGLFTLYHGVCSALAMAEMPPQTDPATYNWGLLPQAAYEEKTFAMFRNALFSFVIDGITSMAAFSHADPEYLCPTSELSDAVGTFAFAHEYGHLVAGHASSLPQVPTIAFREGPISEKTALTEEESRETRWFQEYEADLLGLELLAAIESWVPVDVRVGAIHIFFKMAYAMERAQSLLDLGRLNDDAITKTHPPFLERLAHLEDYIKQARRHDHELFLTFGRSFGDLIDKWFARLIPEIESLHLNGVRAARTWAPGLIFSN